jgi:alkylhydroperoxidase/carboxymuconolactone decarboxylase family protein YurZ
LVVLGALAAQSLPFPLETHLKCALELGELSAEEAAEIAYILGIYVGMPRTTIYNEILGRLTPPKK